MADDTIAITSALQRVLVTDESPRCPVAGGAGMAVDLARRVNPGMSGDAAGELAAAAASSEVTGGALSG